MNIIITLTEKKVHEIDATILNTFINSLKKLAFFETAQQKCNYQNKMFFVFQITWKKRENVLIILETRKFMMNLRRLTMF